MNGLYYDMSWPEGPRGRSPTLVARVSDQASRLLIADDDTGFRETVVEILRPHFQTIDVESAEEAIRVVETTDVDVALFDMNMHLLTGLDAIRWIRQHRSQLPCILMTADLTEELESEAQLLETFSVLQKPLRREQLLDTIHGALEL
jgi:DNA-binding NtrC family response regulator